MVHFSDERALRTDQAISSEAESHSHVFEHPSHKSNPHPAAAAAMVMSEADYRRLQEAMAKAFVIRQLRASLTIWISAH
jgi:hypothetical protein